MRSCAHETLLSDPPPFPPPQGGRGFLFVCFNIGSAHSIVEELSFSLRLQFLLAIAARQSRVIRCLSVRQAGARTGLHRVPGIFQPRRVARSQRDLPTNLREDSSQRICTSARALAIRRRCARRRGPDNAPQQTRPEESAVEGDPPPGGSDGDDTAQPCSDPVFAGRYGNSVQASLNPLCQPETSSGVIRERRITVNRDCAVPVLFSYDFHGRVVGAAVRDGSLFQTSTTSS